MKKNKPIQIVILLGILILGGYAIGSSLFASDGKPQVGDKPPAFSLLGTDGSVHNLEDYKGKGLVVNFWGSWCEPCVREMPLLEEQSKVWKDRNVVFLGINVGEDQMTVSNFVKQFGVTFPLLLDKEKQTTRKYGIGPLPTTVFISSEGKIVDIRIGELTRNVLESNLQRL
ncbi:thiol-disulfide oxidoreductase ResA [Paenibacillus sp. MSJ-34]|uniref:thiol-disulfide oxidoreductase ResA n=1 Tax=Paenibacillus sp. MSJ-34 TaxID=2841529 RepID=UPI001C104A38|nr:thiol-disulfide oxidoreductase ResA [Paenibacillus sp. MSJ-34]MBU5444097.1 thiol-disulfide oxidoreductase ResA [Paenibacillus sp. MSJ-34]